MTDPLQARRQAPSPASQIHQLTTVRPRAYLLLRQLTGPFDEQKHDAALSHRCGWKCGTRGSFLKGRALLLATREVTRYDAYKEGCTDVALT